MTWGDIRDGQFIIINCQHNAATPRQIIGHIDMEPVLKEKLKVWPCIIIWNEDPNMTVHLYCILNNSNFCNKFIST